MCLLTSNVIHRCMYVMIKHYITSSLYSSTIINIIHSSRIQSILDNSIHHQLIMHISFNISSIHYSHLVQFIINSPFISFSPIMNSHMVHLNTMRLFTPQVLINQTPISTYECELHENNKIYQLHYSI